MMKKAIIFIALAVLIIVIVIACLFLSPRKLSDIVDTDSIIKIEIRLFGDHEKQVNITDESIIREFMQDIDECSYKKRMGEVKEGFLFEVLLTHQDKKVDTLVVSGEVVINSDIYTCDGVMEKVKVWFNRYCDADLVIKDQEE